ncbi:MAG: hypothetical protein ACRDT6_05085 [Micromonosporaceae bacterium]
MTRRCVTTLLAPPVWSPPGVERMAWWRALAEDTVDLLATLAEVEVALVATPESAELAGAVRWPSMPVVEIAEARPVLALEAAARLGYDQAAVLAGDAPDLPAMLIGKLMQPLPRRTVAAAPAGQGLLAVAATLPVPDWLRAADPQLDRDGAARLRQAAPRPGLVAVTPGWHRLRDAESFARLDPDLEGWDATRTLLTAG